MKVGEVWQKKDTTRITVLLLEYLIKIDSYKIKILKDGILDNETWIMERKNLLRDFYKIR